MFENVKYVKLKLVSDKAIKLIEATMMGKDFDQNNIVFKI